MARCQGACVADMSMIRSTILLVAALLPAVVAAAPPCGELPVPGMGYGPFDYRTDRDKVGIVEKIHFTPQVEALVSGATGQIGGDLEYVLNKFPNHHRALVAVMRLGERQKTPQVKGMEYPVECYFDRALRFRRDDTVARTLYAVFLGQAGRRDDALRQLAYATEFAGDNALTFFNIGIAYADLRAYPQAVASAKRARELGLARTDLIDRLRKVGQWSEDGTAFQESSASKPE